MTSGIQAIDVCASRIKLLLEVETLSENTINQWRGVADDIRDLSQRFDGNIQWSLSRAAEHTDCLEAHAALLALEQAACMLKSESASNRVDSEPPTHAAEARDNPNEERDKWIYDALCDKKKTHPEILKEFEELATRNGWYQMSVENIQSLKKAAERYADRHNLERIPKRKQGRPSSQQKN